MIHDVLSLHSLKLASELISPHKEHREDLSAAMMILNFNSDFDNVFASLHLFSWRERKVFVGYRWCEAFLRGGGGGQPMLGIEILWSQRFCVGYRDRAQGVWGRGNVAEIYMSNLLAAFLLCGRWGCSGLLEGFHVSQRECPKGHWAFLFHMLHLSFPLTISQSKTGIFAQRARVDQAVGLYYRKENLTF